MIGGFGLKVEKKPFRTTGYVAVEGLGAFGLKDIRKCTSKLRGA